MCVCVYVRVYVCVRVQVYVRMYVCVCAFVPVPVRAYVRVCVWGGGVVGDFPNPNCSFQSISAVFGRETTSLSRGHVSDRGIRGDVWGKCVT